MKRQTLFSAIAATSVLFSGIAMADSTRFGVQIVVDGQSLIKEKRGHNANPCTWDSAYNLSYHEAEKYIHMLVGDKHKISGQGSSHLAISAELDDVLVWSTGTFTRDHSDGAIYRTKLKEFHKVGGHNVLKQPHKVNRVWESQVEDNNKGDTEFFSWAFAVERASEQGAKYVQMGCFKWDPKIVVK